jgi:hypothetical protein
MAPNTPIHGNVPQFEAHFFDTGGMTMCSKKETLIMEKELQELFGEASYQVIKKPCRGKYHGHNDYCIVFGSGRELYVGIDRDGYRSGLREELSHIRYFREHQAENTAKVKALLQKYDTPFCDARLDILPHGGPDGNHLVVYAVIVLSAENGTQFVYRETGLHYRLVTGKESFQTLEQSVEHLVQDIGGSMTYTRVLAEEKAAPKPAKHQTRKARLER